ncbi:hypothetical protein SDC9_22230 [bioreactor metagenome]|uniref:Uncharacterized protein n=1 Tax=bioreactor metagenome TaxID=1076179 RepID=A0A644UBK5_9ZZZZ|nr:hypothetical protein [Acidaminococcaceae bacterium]
MKITSEQPENWIELQNLVSKYLNDAGYSAVSPMFFAIEKCNKMQCKSVTPFLAI